MNSVPLQDLAAQYHAMQPKIDAAIQRVLESGWYILGKEVTTFENEFAAYNDVSGCVGVNSGTDALQLALWACDVGSGDEVITVSHTAVATVAAIRSTGATPVLIDVDPHTYTMSPEALATAITPRTKAIIPVHIYGHPADMEAILTIAQEAGIRVIEDCAQAHGAFVLGKRVGALGDMGCFSFYPTKNLGAVGDGGAVISNDEGLLDRIRHLRQYGWTPDSRYVSQEEGTNSRLDEMQAAILRVKLTQLDRWNQHRRSIASQYDRLLPDAVVGPTTSSNVEHVFHLYVIRAAERDELIAHLRASDIGPGIHYPVPVHQMPAYRTVARTPFALPNTEQLVDEIVSLPMHPMLSVDDVEHVSAAIVDFYA